LKGRLKQLAEGASFGQTIRLQLSLHKGELGSAVFRDFLRVRMEATYDAAAAFVNWPPLPTNPTLSHSMGLLRQIEGPVDASTLCAAAKAEDLPLVQTLLVLGVEPNAGYTESPLAIALAKGGDPIIRCLLAFGADGRHPEVIKFLSQRATEVAEAFLEAAEGSNEDRAPSNRLSRVLSSLENIANKIGASSLGDEPVSSADIKMLLSMPQDREALIKSLFRASEEHKSSSRGR
jgi:hypothetical protein